MDIIEIDMPDGSVVEVEVDENTTDEQLSTALAKAANSGAFSEGKNQSVKAGKPVTFGKLAPGIKPESPVDIKGQPTSKPEKKVEEDGFDVIAKIFAPLSKSMGALPSKGQNLSLKESDKEGGLPVLDVEGDSDEQAGFKAGLSMVADLFSIPERALGGIAAQIKGTDKTILQEMSDPNSSLFKGTKEKLRNSDTNGLLKFLGDAGLSIISDPLFLASMARAPVVAGAKGVQKGLQKRLVSETSESGVTISPKIQGQVSKAVPGVDVPKIKVGIPMTPAERLNIAGKDNIIISQREGNLRSIVPGKVQELKRARDLEFPERIEVNRSSIDDMLEGKNELTGKVAKSFDQEFIKFNKETHEAFEKVKKVAGKHPVSSEITDKSVKDLKTLLPEGGSDIFGEIESNILKAVKLRSFDELAPEELTKHVIKLMDEPKTFKKQLFNELGDIASKEEVSASKMAQRLVSDLSGNKKNVIPETELVKAGLSGPTAKRVEQAITILSSKMKPTFGELRNARSTVKEVEKMLIKQGNARPNDMMTLKSLRKNYTNAMEEHMEMVGGKAGREAFRQTDDEFIDKVGIRQLKKTFYEDDGLTLRAPDKIFESLLKGKDVAKKLFELEKAVPPETFNQLQKAYFNNIFEKASKGGMVSPNQLINTVEKMGSDIVLWNTMLTKEMKDVLAESVLDAFIIKNLKTFTTPKAIESSISKTLKGAGASGVKFAIFHKFGAGKALTFDIARRLFQRRLQATEAKQAADFFQSIDSPSMIDGLKMGGRATLKSIKELPSSAIKNAKTSLNPKSKLSGTGREFLKPIPRTIAGTTAKALLPEEQSLEVTP